MTIIKKTGRVLLCLFLVLALVFLAGRYGWKVFGFNACRGAGIERVTCTGGKVNIKGFYPGSFPCGFIGCVTKEEGGVLYVGFNFSPLFGVFETGQFDIDIPVKGEITSVVEKTKVNELEIWSKNRGLCNSSEYGVYLKCDMADVISATISYDFKEHHVEKTCISEAGAFVLLDTEIARAAKELESPVPYEITISCSNGVTITSQGLTYDLVNAQQHICLEGSGVFTEKDQ